MNKSIEFSLVLENLSSFFKNYFDMIDLLIESYDKTKPKVIKRKIYVRKKRRYRKMIRINHMHDIIGNSLTVNNIALRLLKQKMSETQ